MKDLNTRETIKAFRESGEASFMDFLKKIDKEKEEAYTKEVEKEKEVNNDK